MTLSFRHNDTVKPALLMLHASTIPLCSKLCGYNMSMPDVSLIVCYSIVPCVDYGHDCSTDEMKDRCLTDAYATIHHCPKSCGACT